MLGWLSLGLLGFMIASLMNAVVLLACGDLSVLAHRHWVVYAYMAAMVCFKLVVFIQKDEHTVIAIRMPMNPEGNLSVRAGRWLTKSRKLKRSVMSEIAGLITGIACIAYLVMWLPLDIGTGHQLLGMPQWLAACYMIWAATPSLLFVADLAQVELVLMPRLGYGFLLRS